MPDTSLVKPRLLTVVKQIQITHNYVNIKLAYHSPVPV